MLISLIISLFLTIVIELSVSLILGIKKKNDIYIVVLANICTNPIVVYVANCLKMLNNALLYNIVVMIMEIIVVIVEFKIYKKYLKIYKKSPFTLSIVSNAISFGMGLVINNIL